MPFRWPTDPAGKPAAHTKSWADHQAALKAKQAPALPTPTPEGGTTTTPGQVLPLELPPDSIWTAAAGPGGTLEQARDTRLNNLRQARTAGLLDYGYNEDATTGALSFDPNNPFSKAALLKRNFDQSRQRTGNQMAAGGQLYSGAYQQAQDVLNRGQLQDEDTLQKSLNAFLASNTGDRSQAEIDYQTGLGQVDAERMGRLYDNPLYAATVSKKDADQVTPPKQGIGTAVKVTKKPSTITAGPGVKATKNTTVKKTKKGQTVTYSTSVKGP